MDGESSGVLCYFGCGKMVRNGDDTAYTEVSSWVHGPKRDGATLREETGRRAHAECIEKAKAGQPTDQMELL
jgi:hypothetical protein